MRPALVSVAALLLAFANAACSSDSPSDTGSPASTGGAASAGGSSPGGGGGKTDGSGGGQAGAPGAGGSTGAGMPTSTSLAAATTTATTNVNCVGGAGGKDIRPFYWEIGDEHQKLASGSVDAEGGGGKSYAADTKMAIASASKWFYSTYWIQKIGGPAHLTPADIQFFNFWSGYTNFTSCSGAASVGKCLDIGMNGVQDPETVNFFDYGGGHMQKHAASIAMLADLDNAAFAKEIQSQVGMDIDLSYTEPQPAGGGNTSAAEYAKLLQRILSGELKMKDALGAHPVCVDKTTCPDEAKSSPSPPGEEWHYSIGHWVEDDPTNGDGSFSSPGAFGFYPWIDHDESYYGVVARTAVGGALTSVYCGRLIRKAWLTGTAH